MFPVRKVHIFDFDFEKNWELVWNDIFKIYNTWLGIYYKQGLSIIPASYGYSLGCSK